MNLEALPYVVPLVFVEFAIFKHVPLFHGALIGQGFQSMLLPSTYMRIFSLEVLSGV